MHAGIVGAGLLGRLLAWQLSLKGWHVTLFDKGSINANKSAAYAAAGMLAPYAEAEIADALLFNLGLKSIELWKSYLPTLSQPVFFQQSGSIIVSHTKDKPDLDNFIVKITSKLNCPEIKSLDKSQLTVYEPVLKFNQGYYLPLEGQIDARQLLNALANELATINWHQTTEVTAIKPHSITTKNKTFHFDWVFDCRGYTALDQFKDLRAVRGELIYLHAPEVSLSRPIRLMHPRYRLYMVPRPNNIYLIGASEIESEDTSPISVRTCLELLTAAYSVHPGFAEARIIESITANRPALANNLPRIQFQQGLVAINGLYRHGFLLAPVLIQETIKRLENSPTSIPTLIKEVNHD